MNFITDKQTTDELGLLGKYQSGSVYSLFNKVKTRGGEQQLEQMLRQPLTDAQGINERSAIFRQFQHAAYAFPLKGETVSAFVTWLDGSTESTLIGTVLFTLQKKVLAVLVRDERFEQQQAGVLAAATVINALNDFVSTAMLSKQFMSYDDRIKQIKDLLSDSRLEKLSLLARENVQKLSLRETAYYDFLLKKTLFNQMEILLEFIYELDVYIAVSTVARDKGFGYALAQESTQNELRVKDLKHPCLDKAVGNDLELDSSQNLLFLTGANMAGKSTLMKSIGIALYLAHAGFPVAAKEMRFTVKDGLYSSINVPDNINLGYSHFYAEVLRVKLAAELVSVGKNMLVMFDELFKGTNVKDAYEGTLEVSKAFARYHNCLFIISTHIIEVGEILLDNPNIKFGFMPTIMKGNRPQYPYKLTEGISEDRQGMLIIQNEGILELLEK